MARRANRRKIRPQVAKPRRHETLEDRVVMTADPMLGPALSHHGLLDGPAQVSHHAILDDAPPLTHHDLGPSLGHAVIEPDPNADFWIDTDTLYGINDTELGERVEQTLNDAHGLTGQDEVVSKYGFDGAGQTVAVIDSGIAYSHYALGGGMGSGYRVVGGWDFTENDADFYDDGPEGSHGTHVAGIVGAAGGGTHEGVATGVDLVGLRVFDDAGAGYFSWVEQALDWVHANRNAFDNPITAVNLSLGTSWNSDNIPGWAMLEDEFAALEAEGIFISVSAGNDYTSYNTNGVSYPAASDHVIPVMATDNNGQLSYFSQRADYAIAAPGRWITSTVPDYAANDGDTIDDDWASMSGTSMAAPYVAGASVLIREAFAFVGQTDVDQWDIYNHMMATGDSFYDSASDTTYKRLNLEAAIDAIMPVDDFGSSVDTAYNLGTINAASQASTQANMSGVISTLTDGDYFTFTAGATGALTVTASGVTHDLVAQWDAWGGAWNDHGGGVCSIDVVAGQTYTIALSSSDGLGYYDLAFDLQSTFSAVDWGSLAAQQTQSGLTNSGEQWYRVVAGQSGYLTAEAIVGSGSATVAIYDAQQTALTSSSARADATVVAGAEYLVQVTGDASSLDIRLTNALNVSGGVATLVGTAGKDALNFTAGSSSHTVSLNGVNYSVTTSQATTFNLSGGGGTDTLTLVGSSDNETAQLRVGSATVTSAAYALSATGHTNATFEGGGGSDTAIMNDSSGADVFEAWSDRAEMTGSGYSNSVTSVDRAYAYASDGSDTARMHDTTGDDLYYAWADKVVMTGAGYYNYAWGFDQTVGIATTGLDAARFYDTAGDENFDAFSTHAVMSGSGFSNRAEGFDQNYAFSTGGDDTAQLRDSAGDDNYRAWSDRAILNGAGFYHYAQGFARTYAYALNGGDDHAIFNDTAGDDLYYAWHDKSVMTGAGFYNYTTGFAETHAYASGGMDVARLYDSAGADQYYGWSDRVVLTGAGYYSYAGGFDQTYAFSSGGGDTARLYDTTGSDRYRGWSDRSVMDGLGYYNYAAGFGQTFAFSSGQAGDTAHFYDSAGETTYSDLTVTARLRTGRASTTTRPGSLASRRPPRPVGPTPRSSGTRPATTSFPRLRAGSRSIVAPRSLKSTATIRSPRTASMAEPTRPPSITLSPMTWLWPGAGSRRPVSATQLVPRAGDGESTRHRGLPGRGDAAANRLLARTRSPVRIA